MPLETDPGQVLSLLEIMGVLIQGGALVWGYVYICMHIQRRLSVFTRLKDPDPTVWKRSWRRFFDQVFHRAGERVMTKEIPGVRREVLYQLGISGAVLIVAMAAYLFTSGAFLGAAYVSYHTLGFVPELAPLIEQTAAFIILFAIAVSIYSWERAAETIPQQ